MDYYPVKLLAVRQTEQELVMGAVMLIIWNDLTRLSWDPHVSPVVKSIHVQMKRIWYPSIGHLRSVDANYKLDERMPKSASSVADENHFQTG